MHSLTPSNSDLLSTLVLDRDRYIRFAAARLHSTVDAEDAVQAALEKACKYLNQVQDPEALHGWFLTILRRTVSDTQRAQSRMDARYTTLHDSTLENVCADPDVEDQSSDAWMCDCSIALLETLPPEHVRVLSRVVVDEEPIRVVADELSMTPNATRVRLHRARKELRSRVEEMCGVTSLRESYDCACVCETC